MKVWKRILIFLGIARFLTVAILFINPYLAEALSLLFDDIDGSSAYKAGLSWKGYMRYDKTLDYWWYIFILIYSVGKPIFVVMLILFLIRSVGQIATVITTKHELLFWFPNVFEHYFILYLLASLLAPQYLHYFSGAEIVLPLAIAFITKIPQEYLQHQKGWFYDPDKWPRSIKTLHKRKK